ncbi:MAG: molybdenum cofactor biosynthesis protein MoaE [Lentisphaeraceae bacterium]|nr:molybdenum cofactor biosynthesis protein MoaE [Lentisphaeraceae bacterium]
MKKFRINSNPVKPEALKQELFVPEAGGFVSFEGWVRNRNEGKDVTHLEYSSYDALAVKEGLKIIDEAIERFDVVDALVEHRVGDLQIGEVAVVVHVSSIHRGPAFDACEYIIDELKVRVPIWKKEHYTDGDSGWIECHECSKHAH